MKGNQTFMIKNPKHFHLSTPSQLNQKIECDFVKKGQEYQQ